VNSVPSDGASLPRVALRALKLYHAQELTDRAAALVYYALLSLFPALLASVSLLGLFGEQGLVTDASEWVLEKGADQPTADSVSAVLDKIVSADTGALGLALVVSMGLALNGASGAFAAAGRALNLVNAIDDERGFVRRKLVDIAITVAVLVLVLVVISAVFVGGGIVEDIAGAIGLGDTGALVWRIVRWPLAFAAAMLAYGLIYAFAPAGRPGPKRFRWISPGAAFGVVLWLLASAGFAVYVQNIATLGAAYGGAGGLIVLLLWLFLSANAFLLGAQLDAELDRQKTAGRSAPPFPTPPPSPEMPAPPARTGA
jgi:membrane protein